MSTPHEVQRLTHIYGHYRLDNGTQQRWDMHNPGNRAIARERSKAITYWLQRGQIWPLAEQRILDVGCGSGHVLASLLPMGASAGLLHGVDLLPERIFDARKQYPSCHFECINAEQLPYPDGVFDLVLIFTVFSSIMYEGMAQNVAGEIRRVLAPRAAILWYDFRYDNPRNPNVLGMTTRHISSLFPGFRLQLETITLLPPLARRLGPLTSTLYPVLASLPWLRTHYIGLLHRQQ